MEFLLKQRLVGAVVLVALGVIFIPMLLEGPRRDLVPEMEPLPEPGDQPITEPLAQFPAAEEVPPAPDTAVIQVDTAPDSPAADGEKPVAEGGETLPLPLPEPEPVAAPQPRPEAAKPAAVKPAPAKPATANPGALGNWVVQVGSFSSEQNALRLRDKLRKAGFVTQVERVRVSGKTRYRVRVGPYLERAEADRDLEKLGKTLDLKGRVLSYP